ncbi:MAG: hypothetical protein LBJ16_00465 [Holosporaceae bacterium]|nr:hypothetical protein [Holosporaceae bacterium]
MLHEDPSTEATQKLPKERMFRKKSIRFFDNFRVAAMLGPMFGSSSATCILHCGPALPILIKIPRNIAVSKKVYFSRSF